MTSRSRALAVTVDRQVALSRPSRAEDVSALNRSVRRPVRLGLTLIAVFMIGGGVWAATAPLAGGAVAPGVISPDGNRKTVQHLEGGIIARLEVRDGDVVQAGQPLVILESIQPRASFEALLNQYRTLVAMRTRLHAEQANREHIDWPAELQGATDDAELRAIIAGQQQMFETRRATHSARKRVLQQQIEQLQEQVRGLEAQVASTTLQLKFIAEELAGKEELRRKEIVTKPEILRLQRTQAEISGNRGEFIASIAAAKQKIGETELQLMAIDAERADDIATKLDQVRAELATVRERLFASEDILKRTVVTAPVAGTVVNLRFKTEGGVVQRGEPILDIVPADDALLIDARVAPNDIDVVHAGLSAQIHLSAYTSRAVPRIDGKVRSVSADRFIDEYTRQPYYLARVEVDRATLTQIDSKIELIPGMPAEVLIVTGERTLVDYLIEPFLDVFRRSFREV
jgi:HlyD family secretion protein/epimerase transport system membrane fusion protein